MIVLYYIGQLILWILGFGFAFAFLGGCILLAGMNANAKIASQGKLSKQARKRRDRWNSGDEFWW